MPMYRTSIANGSLYALPWRIFQGNQFDPYPVIKILPLFYAPKVPPVLAPLLVLLFLGAGFFLAWRTDFAAGLAICVCLSILASPISWGYYLLLVLIPAAVLWDRLPGWQLAVILILISIPFLPVTMMIELINSPLSIQENHTYSVWANAWTIIPVGGVILAILMLFRSRLQQGYQKRASAIFATPS
jgi:hypothetical protein